MKFLPFILLFFFSVNVNAKVVGILTDKFRIEDDICDDCGMGGDIYTIQQHVLNAIQESCNQYGISVVLIPNDPFYAKLYVKNIDGMIVPNFSREIDAKVYGRHSSAPKDKKDDSESKLAVVKTFLETKKPILGINKGMHIINIAFGGDIKRLGSDNKKIHQLPSDETHDININKDSKVYNAVIENDDVYEGYIKVNSMHKDTIGELGNDLNPSAFSRDGSIEAIESKDDSFVLGVQWNPEHLNTANDIRLFQKFCKKVAKGDKKHNIQD
ncbi:gamma-glutamyl-gamma-aminobutyrate hydrolase family protein [Candidatus Deianiraea vastatrix]|uniref:Glutamine amidotransferase n=1 Tax=Candidatus Deianiraea vastatrix TaxID=2163644 RepID=A0A5B8XE07_9RICK|nr:gamma-glutamyl-gamma-aminobutyrate hydrolase family protein [Candidatus Deianiraea vastatrix]QED23542.1 Putative glutamine amidotransferase [Candidatus Deianiraea vastatrix]